MTVGAVLRPFWTADPWGPLAPAATPTLTIAEDYANSSVVLSWNITGSTYTVYRDNVVVGTTASTTYTDKPTSNALIAYRVMATNSAGSSSGDNTVYADFRTYSSLVKADNPTMYWRLNELTGTTVSDTGTNGATRYPGTLVTGANAATFGRPGPTAEADSRGVYLNNTTGTSQSTFSTLTHINYGNTPNMQQAYTVDGWIKTNSATVWNGFNTNVGDWSPILTRSEAQFMLRSHGTGSKKVVFSTPGTTPGDSPATLSDILTAQWIHLAVVMDPIAGTKRIYVNGNLEGEAAYTGTPGATTNPLLMGAQGGSFSRAVDGTFSEWAIYFTALSPERIKAHYDARLVPTISSTPTVTQFAAFGIPL